MSGSQEPLELSHSQMEQAGPASAADVADVPDRAQVDFVAQLLTALGKCVRAHQIYHSNNPVYQRFVEGLREGFRRLWTVTSTLELRVEESSFAWGVSVYTVGEGRDSLPFQFYKDGIRFLTFLPGFEDELERFLEVVHRSRQVNELGDDLITLLWEADFESLQSAYVDQLSEVVELPSPGAGLTEPVAAAEISAEVLEVQEEAPRPDAPPPPAAVAAPALTGLVSRDDFEETLFFLDPSEIERLQQEMDREWNRDLKADVLNALFDRLEDALPAQQQEVLAVLQQLLPLFLARGELVAASNIVLELQIMLDQGDTLLEDNAAKASSILDQLSEAEMLTQLIHSMAEGAIDPDAAELGIFLNYLRPGALPILIRATESTTMPGMRERLRTAMEGIGREHAEDVLHLLEEAEPMVAAGAARLAGRLRLMDGVTRLGEMLERTEDDVRIAAVEALAQLHSSATVEALQGALSDANREVRITAARSLGALRYAPARRSFEEIMNGAALRDADLTEKIAVFEAYGQLAGAQGVKLLDRMLNGRGFLGGRQPTEMRACAARALGRIASPAAESALRSAAGDKEALVRNAVSGALRRVRGS